MESTDSVIADLSNKVPLDKDERVVASCLARLPSLPLMVTNARFGYGLLLLTNKRLVYVEAWPKKVLLNKPLKDLASVGLERNVLVGGELRTLIKVTSGNGTDLFDIVETRPAGITVEELVEQMRQLRAREQNAQKEPAIVVCQYCGLKNRSDEAKCSSCGAPLPTTG